MQPKGTTDMKAVRKSELTVTEGAACVAKVSITCGVPKSAPQCPSFKVSFQTGEEISATYEKEHNRMKSGGLNSVGAKDTYYATGLGGFSIPLKPDYGGKNFPDVMYIKQK